MSVQCTANSLRALAALPAPSPSRRLARNECLMPCRPSRTGALVRAADSSPPAAPASSSGAADDKAVIPDDEFTLAKVSFGVIGLGIGGSLLSYGFGAYFNLLPGSEWSALMLTYGFPLTIIGMALKYAELKPVPCITYSDAFALREKCATPILKQVTDDGKYCLVLEFEAKSLELSDFEKRQSTRRKQDSSLWPSSLSSYRRPEDRWPLDKPTEGNGKKNGKIHLLFRSWN
ncbi:uncharacterized protein [Aegilops tauschii subsp. strangulata]|nr:uncharacterized protein LOC109785613 isoform X9 [Aegilops tauschii subsp. strangulata]